MLAATVWRKRYGTTARAKTRALRERPQCSLLILDTENPYRFVEVRGCAEIAGDADDAFAQRLAQKYDGAEVRQYDPPGSTRVVVAPRPERSIRSTCRARTADAIGSRRADRPRLRRFQERLPPPLRGARLSLARKAILGAAENRTVRRFVSKHGMRLGGSRFVAGETMDDAIRTLRELNDKGLAANTTLLGEAIRDAGEARAVADEYVVLVDRIASERLRANVALKLTHLGLDLDEALAYENVRRIVERGHFIRIDMEQSAYVDATLRIYRRLREDGLDNVGTVLQAYLYRTEQDLESLLPLQPNLRLVKGAYLEPPEVAYPKKADVDAAYVRLMETMLRAGGYTAIATHDEAIIEHAIRFADEHAIPRSDFEFQMLYGVRPQLQLDLAARGYKVLVATPYGPEWYPYLMRRLGERPANALFLLRNLVKR